MQFNRVHVRTVLELEIADLVLSETFAAPFMKRDAVAVETPAVLATPLNVHSTTLSSDPLELNSCITQPLLRLSAHS